MGTVVPLKKCFYILKHLKLVKDIPNASLKLQVAKLRVGKDGPRVTGRPDPLGQQPGRRGGGKQTFRRVLDGRPHEWAFERPDRPERRQFGGDNRRSRFRQSSRRPGDSHQLTVRIEQRQVPRQDVLGNARCRRLDAEHGTKLPLQGPVGK